MNELALFAGAGGGILGGHLLGWRTVCAVEWESYPASVLCARQNDGLLPPFPIWDDVQTFDGKPWRGIVDVISGGFPCQDISAAGKGVGIDGERSGMWGEMARIIYEVRPRFVFVENSPMLTSRGLGRVLGDLASMGFDARWGVLGAADVGANHQRNRIWIAANSNLHGFSSGQNEWRSNSLYRQDRETEEEVIRWEIGINGTGKISSTLADTDCNRLHGSETKWDRTQERPLCQDKFDNGSGVWSEINRCSQSGNKKEIPNPSSIGSQKQTNERILESEGWSELQSEQSRNTSEMANSTSIAQQGQGKYEQSIDSAQSGKRKAVEPIYGRSSDFWAVEPNVGRVANGVADRVDRLKAIGNGQVPLCAATAWRILSEQK